MDRRLAAYRRAIERIGEGTFDVTVESPEADEIGDLGRALAKTARVLDARFTEAERLLELSARVNSGVRLEEVLDHLYTSFHDILPYDRIGLSLMDPDKTTLRAVWARTNQGIPTIASGFACDIRLTSLQRVLDTGLPRVINDLETYLAENPNSDSTRLMLTENIRSSLTCPLVVTGHAVGLLFFSSSTPHSYGCAHVDLFKKIATHLSWAIEKSRLYEDLVRTRDDLCEANRRLERLAAIDGLTEVPNRRTLDGALEREWGRAQRNGAPNALVIFDVDDFKAYNDTYGHVLGDGVLRLVAKTLRASFHRAGDLVGRFGGEEFAALLPGTDGVGARYAAERARQRVESLGIPHVRASATPHLTISSGVAACVPRRGMAPEALLTAADAALYTAKRAGRNSVFLQEASELPTVPPPPPSTSSPSATALLSGTGHVG